MKPLLQKLPLDTRSSFIAKTFRTPHFEVGWHQHIECELILFTEGSGLSLIGNHVGEFESGDIYFLGANLPHTFQKREPNLITSAVVVQFRENWWGDAFMTLPETKLLHQLFSSAKQGLKIDKSLCSKLTDDIIQLEKSTGFKRLLLLGSCLEKISVSKEWAGVSTQDIKANTDDRIAKVIEYTLNNFREPMSLSQVASIACMSIKSFCSYFKKSTKKTFIDFLNEVRVGFACNLLTETKLPVQEICYESGYSTVANFHKQFMKLRGSSPLKYRVASNLKH